MTTRQHGYAAAALILLGAALGAMDLPMLAGPAHMLAGMFVGRGWPIR